MKIQPHDEAFWFALVTTDGKNPPHRSLHQFATRDALRLAFTAWLATREWTSTIAFECGVDNEGGV